MHANHAANQISLQIFQGPDLQDSDLSRQIIALDRENMRPFFEELGLELPLNKRLAGMSQASTVVIAASQGPNLLGYLEYCEDWSNPKDLYFSSIQIARPSRHGPVFRLLLCECIRQLEKHRWRTLRAGVQKSNHRMQAMLKKLDFKLYDPGSEKTSLVATGDRSVLESSIVQRLRQ